MGSVDRWGFPRTSQRSTGQNHFHGNTNIPFAIFPVLSLAQMRKSNGGSKCWCLSTNLAVAPTTVAVSCSHHARTGKKKKKSQFYSGIPDELPNSLIFLNPHPSVWASSMFFVVKWALCMKYGCTRGQGPPWGRARAQLRVTSSTGHFSMQCRFYLKEQLTNYGCSDFGIWEKFSWKGTKWASHFTGNNW